MARSIWSGSLSFGLVNIPVTLSSAVDPQEVHFHLLHDADGARINERRICSADGKEVPWSHVVKGYQADKGRTVMVTSEELDRFAPEITKTIDIEQFVDLAEIDPIYYQKSYYVEPSKSGAKAYRLLSATMELRTKVAIARVVLRQKQHLCALRSRDGQLVLSTMFFPDEIRKPNSQASHVRVAPKEQALAEQLIANLESPFAPQKLHDQYREKLLVFLKKKAKSKGVESEPAATESEAPTAVTDLMTALSASLQQRRAAPRPTGAREATRPRRRRARSARTPARRRKHY